MTTYKLVLWEDCFDCEYRELERFAGTGRYAGNSYESCKNRNICKHISEKRPIDLESCKIRYPYF